MWAEFFLDGMKEHSNKGGRKILLGDNTGGGRGGGRAAARRVRVCWSSHFS